MILPRKRILVAEDDPSILKMMKFRLEHEGYLVLSAADGEEAIRKAVDEGPIHLVLTDVIMPQISGPALVQSLVCVRPALKVLYMSGYLDEALAAHGVLETGVTLLQKPFTGDVLVQRVRTVLET